MTATRYALEEDAWFGEEGWEPFLHRVLERPGIHRICELGGGASPALPPEFSAERGIEHWVLDISAEELAKAPEGYRKLQADVCAPGLDVGVRFDAAFSIMLAEHVRDGRQFHQNVYNLLEPGGLAFHFFPTLYAVPFVVNRLLPEALTYRMLSLVQRGREREGRHGKFPARYSWCRGPTERQMERFASLGFDVLEYHGFFGSYGYYGRIPPLRRAEHRLARALVARPRPALTSYAFLLLQKRS